MKNNGFEKYNNYFDIIGQNCNEENKLGVLSLDDSIDLKGYEHFLLEGGLHVYKKDEAMVITKEDITGYAIIPGKKILSGDHRERVSMYRNESLNSCGIRVPFGRIEYVEERITTVKDSCDLPLALEKEYDKLEERDKYVADSSKRYITKGELSTDVDYILEEVRGIAENEETRAIYEEALDLHNSVLQIAREYKKQNEMKNDNIENILRLSTKKVEVREKNEQAKELYQQNQKVISNNQEINNN